MSCEIQAIQGEWHDAFMGSFVAEKVCDAMKSELDKALANQEISFDVYSKILSAGSAAVTEYTEKCAALYNQKKALEAAM